jgi:hypothetical protein
MSDITNKHKVTIEYNCTETGQKALVEVEYTKGDKSYIADVKLSFDPEPSDETRDPMGFLRELITILGLA